MKSLLFIVHIFITSVLYSQTVDTLDLLKTHHITIGGLNLEKCSETVTYCIYTLENIDHKNIEKHLIKRYKMAKLEEFWQGYQTHKPGIIKTWTENEKKYKLTIEMLGEKPEPQPANFISGREKARYLITVTKVLL